MSLLQEKDYSELVNFVEIEACSIQQEPNYLDWSGLRLEIEQFKDLIWEMDFIVLPVMEDPTIQNKKMIEEI